MVSLYSEKAFYKTEQPLKQKKDTLNIMKSIHKIQQPNITLSKEMDQPFPL